MKRIGIRLDAAYALVRCLLVTGGFGLGLMLAGCTAAKPTVTPTLAPAKTTTPQPTPTEIRLPDTWTPAPTATSTPVPPSVTPSPTYTLPPLWTDAPTSTLDPRLPVLNPVETLTLDDLKSEDNVVLHDLIVFTSLAGKPLVGTNVGVPSSISFSGSLYAGTQLWAFSPDGKRAGRLTSQELAFVSYWSEREGEDNIWVQEEGVTYNHALIQGLNLPGECYGGTPGSEASPFNTLPCSDFQFSPGGRTLGFFYGPDICGRGIILVQPATGKVIYRGNPGGAHGFEFLRDGKVLMMEGHCEGGTVSLYDPLQDRKTVLGDEGLAWWTSNRNALAVAYGAYSRYTAGVWVFDALTDKLVKPSTDPDEMEREDHAVWSRNGRYLIYQRREITEGEEGISFDGPRQVMRLDMQNGEITVLTGEEGYDYHLCEGNQAACVWYGGVWQQVRRVPFEPQSFPYSEPAPLDCLLDGLNCESEVELFALNVETGEMIPWDESGYETPAAVPTITPTPTSSGPENSAPDFQAEVVYMHPSGYYAFYPGTDGHSLWMVPVEGEPVLWVRDGENFIYLP